MDTDDGPLTETQRRRVAGRARTLAERLDRPTSEGPPVADPDDWLASWRENLGGSADAVERRLDRTDTEPDGVRDALSTHGWPAGEPLPAWIDELDDLLAAVDAREFVPDPPPDADGDVGQSPDADGDVGQSPDADGERPFTELFDVLARAAQRRVEATPQDLPLDDFRELLADRLSRLLAHPLFVEFKTFLADRDRELALGDEPDPPDDPRRHYEAFLAELFSGGLTEFVVEYAFGARLLTTVVRQWIGTVETFGRRLAADRSALRSAFADGDELGRVVGVESYGDPHDGGETVLRVSFASGVTVAYKPRETRPTAAFADLLDWLDDRTEIPSLRTPTTLVCEGYGWVEWIEPQACESPAGAERYYRRAGALLAVLSALNFTDGHLENLVAVGDQPVVVDLETLARPGVRRERLLGGGDVFELFEGTVVETGLVPLSGPGDDFGDMSGFGTDELESLAAAREFTDTNTDLMELQYDENAVTATHNLPTVDGETVPATDHPGALRAGFRAGYDALLATRERLLAENGPLSPLADCSVRYVHRSTWSYATIRLSLTTPEYVRTGLAFGCKAESLVRPVLTGRLDETGWTVFDNERAALARFDVPKFTVRTDSTDLSGPDEAVASFFETTPLGRLRDRLDGLHVEDREEQCTLLEMAFEQGVGSEETRVGAVPVTDCTDAVAPDWDWTAFDPDDLPELDPVARADDCARAIRDRAFRDDDGTPIWYVPNGNPAGSIELPETGEILYSGRVGIAAFLAAAGELTDDPATTRFAEETLAPVRDTLRADDPAGDLPLGIGMGIGSLVYGLCLVDSVSSLGTLSDARRASELVTRDRIADDGMYGVLGGSAGAVLALLALADRTGGSEPVATAVACGEHLLSNRTGAGGRAWIRDGESGPKTGFAHGASGIAFALARLADVTGETRFRTAATEALAVERERADSARRGDLDPARSAVGNNTWCNGRTGLGLARLGLFEHDAGVERSVARSALDAVDHTQLDRHDTFCHGNASRAACLLRGGRSLDAPAYERRARDLLSATCARADAADGYLFSVGTRRLQAPSLFGGLSGLGYTLLRVARPALPSLVAWE